MRMRGPVPIVLSGIVVVTVPIVLLALSTRHQSTAPAATLEIVTALQQRETTVSPRILFIGDVMLDRVVALHAREKGDEALIARAKDLLSGEDAIVANLEGTITTNASVSIPDHDLLAFTFDPHFAIFLKNLGISAVSLSNNHTFDFGESGYASTKAYLQQAGITSFGSPHNDDELSSSILVQGTRVCLVGYEGFIAVDPAPIAREIARIRPSCDLVIATMHAGVEYAPDSTSEQQVAAHAFIDAGADAVIGTHPHVVEPLEIYKGKAIFYSLGNFLFDQNFSFETSHAIVVRMELADAGPRYTVMPITIQGEEVSHPSAEDGARTLAALVGQELPPDISSAILNQQSFTTN